jgi:hypothetical protein
MNQKMILERIQKLSKDIRELTIDREKTFMEKQASNGKSPQEGR